MTSATEKRRKMHSQSILLTEEENHLIFNMIPQKCLSLSTSVVQLYTTEYPAHSHWVKHVTGVLCFIKDNGQRSYFFHIYCTESNQLVWQQELYNRMEIHRSRPFLITFQGNTNVVALSFASEDEAGMVFNMVSHHLARKLENETKTRRLKTEPSIDKSLQMNAPSKTNENYESVVLRRELEQKKLHPPNDKQQLVKEFGPNRKPVQKKRNICKTTIGEPMHFVHVAHLGFDQKTGFDSHGEGDILEQVLQKAGIWQDYQQDRATRAFVDDVWAGISNNSNPPRNNRRELNQKKNLEAPAPPTRRQYTKTKDQKQDRYKHEPHIPPPPPKRSPPMPSIPAPILGEPNIEMNKISSKSGAGAGAPPPPPPPPPPPMMAPDLAEPNLQSGPKSSNNFEPKAPQNDPHSALLKSIQQGATLRKVDRDELPAKKLPATTEPTGEEGENTGIDALASALLRALDQRGRAMRSSDESSNESDNQDWD